MSAQKKTYRGKKLMTIAVLALLALLSVANLKIVKEPLGKFVRHELSFEGFSDEVQKGYVSNDFAHKNDFVNLNGLFARVTGRRTLNEVVKLNNAMLGEPLQAIDTTELADGITEFSGCLSEEGIPFLYVQMPCKEALNGQSFPTGIVSYANQNADALLSSLSAGNVKTLDLRPVLSQTPEILEQYFTKTDHHWNNDGAFVAFQEILDYLYKQFPDGGIDLTYGQADQWERHSIDKWFLGSKGKRVGTFFGGIDPLIWYTPKFETEMSCAIPKYGSLFRGDFTEANIRTKYIEEKNYFGYSAYDVYIGGDYPLVQHRNLKAPSSLKVIMLKDSFTLPLQAYLSTVFQEIDVVDPRHFSECTIAEYVEQTEPDIVILAINPSQFANGAYRDFGVEKAISINSGKNNKELVDQKDIKIEARDSNYNYTAYPLDADTSYQITFDGVDILEGKSEGVGLVVYDRTASTALESTILDLAYCDAVNDYSLVFRTPNTQDKLELLFYAGIYGSTAGTGVTYQNVTVEKWHNATS